MRRVSRRYLAPRNDWVQPALGGGGEDRHVGADLGDDVLGADDPDAVELVQLPDLVQVRLGQRSGVLIGEEGAFRGPAGPGPGVARRAPQR